MPPTHASSSFAPWLRVSTAVGLMAGAFLAWTIASLPTNTDAQAPKIDRPRPGSTPAPTPPAGTSSRPTGSAAVAGPADSPQEGTLYVWQQPDKGFQTLLIFRVQDGNTLEAAYLVPVLVRHYGAQAPDITDKDPKSGLPAKNALDRLLAGRLAPARLAGRDKAGRLVADFYLGAPDPKDKDAPSGWSSQHLTSQRLATPWAPAKGDSKGGEDK